MLRHFVRCTRCLSSWQAWQPHRRLRYGLNVPVSLNLSRRLLSTPPPQLNVSDLSQERYHELSDATMDSLLSALEDLLDEIRDPSYEVEYHSGVLTLVLGDRGTYVINKQPPNKQIWLSSPFSGPKRYDYVEALDNWAYSRDGVSMGTLLDEELTHTLGRKVELGVELVSEKVP